MSGEADTVFFTDTQHNFRRCYDGIEVDGCSAGRGELPGLVGDRASHLYECLVDGSNDHMPFRLEPPPLYRYCAGTIIVQVELLPAGTPTLAAQQAARAEAQSAAAAAEEQRQELLRKQEEQARLVAAQQERVAAQQERLKQEEAELQRQEEERQRQRAEQARQEAEREKKVAARATALKIKVHESPNFFQPEFCEHYARKNLRELLSDSCWKQEYEALLADTEVVAKLRLEAPEVLVWYQRRLDVIALAERLSVIPEAVPQVQRDAVEARVPITQETLGDIEQIIADLYQLRREYDRMQQEQTADGQDRSKFMTQMLKNMACRFDQLKRHNIFARTPEDAEQQLRVFCPIVPVISVYQQIRERVEAGEAVGLDIIVARVKDLFSEQCALIYLRKRAIRRKEWAQQQELDARLEHSRGEFAAFVDFLRGRGCQLELGPPEREDGLSDGVLRLAKDKDRTVNMLEQLGQHEEAEAVKALYAAQMIKLFHGDDEDYS